MFSLNQYFCELRRILVWRGSGHVELVVNIDKLTGNCLLPLTKGELIHSPLFRFHICAIIRAVIFLTVDLRYISYELVPDF